MKSFGSSLDVRMSWHDLLFAHWTLPVDVLRPHIPAALEVDARDGTGWIGVVPFRMSRVGPRLLPPLPGVSDFPELNVRTYVLHGDRPGVWFFSLDAANRLAVRVARKSFHLPYFDARMSCRETDGWVDYKSVRTHKGAPPAEFVGRYRPTGTAAPAPKESLEFWLTERYSLYSASPDGTVYRGDIDHPSWPLQPAEAQIETNEMTALVGTSLEGPPAHLLFARRVDVMAAPLVRVS